MFLRGAKLFAFEKFKQKISALRNEQKYLILFVDHYARCATRRALEICIYFSLGGWWVPFIYLRDYALIVDFVYAKHI